MTNHVTYTNKEATEKLGLSHHYLASARYDTRQNGSSVHKPSGLRVFNTPVWSKEEVDALAELKWQPAKRSKNKKSETAVPITGSSKKAKIGEVELLSSLQASKELGVSTASIHLYCKDKKLNYAKIGASFVVYRDAKFFKLTEKLQRKSKVKQGKKKSVDVGFNGPTTAIHKKLDKILELLNTLAGTP